jgi:hypothetical protein
MSLSLARRNDHPAYAASASQLLEFDQNGKFVRDRQESHAWSGHTVRVDQHDNIWRRTKARHGRKFNPRPVVMVFGPNRGFRRLRREALKPPLPPEIGRFRQVTDVTWTVTATPISATATSIR